MTTTASDDPDMGGAVPPLSTYMHDENPSDNAALEKQPPDQQNNHDSIERDIALDSEAKRLDSSGVCQKPTSNHCNTLSDDYESMKDLPDVKVFDSMPAAPSSPVKTNATSPTIPRRAEEDQDDDVQIIGCRDTTELDLNSVRNTLLKPPVVIDLTEDDNDSEEDSYIYHRAPDKEPVRHIKTEPCEDPGPASQEAFDPNHISTKNFEALPELGFTNVPGENDLNFDHSNLLGNEFDSVDMMAQMLSQFNQASELEIRVDGDDRDSDGEDLQAREVFENKKTAYEKLKQRGEVAIEAQIDFARAENAEQQRRRARESRKQYEKDWNKAVQAEQLESLFIPENDDASVQQDNDDASIDQNDQDIVGNSGYQFASAVRSTTPARALDTISSAKKPARGRPRGKKSETARKTAGKSAVTKQPGKTARVRGGKKRNEPTLINPTSLLHHDIIAEAIRNQGQQTPSFTARVKKDALAQLISSIPAEERDQYAGDKANLKKATQNFNGRGAIRADGNGNWRLRGMKTSLKNYQLLGVSWMRDRENQLRNPRGGILGDDMGLGKTVSALANMVDGKPASTYTGAKATLVVVPASLMNQWMEEIEKHIENPGKVVIYRSTMKFIDPAQYLAEHDVVITSYQEVVRSLPKKDPPPQMFTARAKEEWWLNEVAKHKGPLHQFQWYRIILDEAQAIKNHLSKTSEAVCHLRSRYKWCLSGTPIQNCLEEFYPYFRFLKFDNTGSYELFKHNFCKRGSDKAFQRLQILLDRYMLRRTHCDVLFGKPILTLPPIKPVETIEVKFNAVERAIYHIVRQRFIIKVRALTNNGGNDNYQAIFVLLLRLRQLVGHPLLIQKTLKDCLEVEDLEKLWQLTKSKEAQAVDDDHIADSGRDTVTALQFSLDASQNSGTPSNAPGSASGNVNDNQLSNEFRKYLQALHDDGSWNKINERSMCVACGSPPASPYITSCMHLYCLACLNDLHYTELLSNKSETTCLSCGSTIKASEAYASTAYDEARSFQNAHSPRPNPEEDIDWHKLGSPVLRSAKIKGAVAQIKKWFQQDPTNKIIVFTQFRGMIKVMEKVCQEENNWGSASYHGCMSFEFRDEQVKRFKNDPDCRILLAAMKAGGVGLNLTMANRVIILDLWWNVSVESQAFTRCFRIGQERDVEVVRFVVRDSIDTDIQAMQARKIAEIEKAMETNRRPRNLTMQELLELFGDAPKSTTDTQATTSTGGPRNQQAQTDDTDDAQFILPDDPYDPMDAIEGDQEDVIMTGTN